MSAQSFLSELKRRQIYRGGVMYVVAGWVIVEVATTVFPYFSIPEWAIRLLIVMIMLGFPVALVALWMFESSLPDPNARLHERRANRGDGGSDELAKLLQAERAERVRESQELIAALAQLKGSAHGQAATAGDPIPPMQPVAPMAMAAPPVASIAPRRPRWRAPVLVAVFLVVSVLAAVWALGVPEVSTEQAKLTSSEIAEQYMAPGYRYVERFGVSLLTPLLHKLGLGWSPHNVFTVLMVLLALFVLRRMYRGFAVSRRPRRVARMA